MAKRARRTTPDTKKTQTVASVTQGYVPHISGTIVTVKQGSSITTTSQQLDLFQGIVGLARTNEANLTATQAGIVLASGTVAIDQSAAGVVSAKGMVSMDKSAAVFLCANEVHAENSGAVFLLSKHVRGSVKTVFGPREALIVGAAAGIAAGLVVALGRLLTPRRNRT